MTESLHVVTANRTDDGGVVYLSLADGVRQWSTQLDHAAVFSDEAEQASALTWAKTQETRVTDPYVMKVTQAEAGLRPLSAREQIRSEGPAVTLHRLGYQAAAEAGKAGRGVSIH